MLFEAHYLIMGTIVLIAKNVEAKAAKDLSISSYAKRVLCRFQPNSFNCDDKGLWNGYYYDHKVGECLKTIAGNCPHNYNVFESESECLNPCKGDEGPHPINDITMKPSVFCRLQPDFGDCQDYKPSYYYDVTHRQCKGFSYSGCGGNLNRFTSTILCQTVCLPAVEPL